MLITTKLGVEIGGDILFENINISLGSSSGKKVALVGRNGCGKTTLLRVLNREIEPDSGSVSAANENIGYLPQEIDFTGYELAGEFLESKISEKNEEYKIDIALGKIGLSEDYIYKLSETLSGGEKIKVALAGLLIDDPNILLLDEPTNNLDIDGIAWLIKFIKEFKGSIILVSHDRYLINRAINEIWEIDPNTLGINVYGGNYDSYVAERERIYNKMLSEYGMIDREIKRIEMWLRENEQHPKYRFSNFVMSQKAKLAKLKARISDKPVSDPDIKINDLGSSKRGLVLKLNIASKSYGTQEVLSDLEFKIYQGERVLISGPNGSGKTTLLRIITGQDKEYEGEVTLGDGVKVGYLEQFSNLDTSRKILDEFEAKTGTISPLSRSILARYGFDAEMIYSPVSFLSYGQLKRLDLAIILASNPGLLVLDEPTNHLDIYTREDLEEFIINQTIPMIIVSHDRYFVEKVGIGGVVELG